MRKWYWTILMLLSLVPVACEKDFRGDVQEPDLDGIILRFTTQDPVTKVQVPGVDSLNENKLGTTLDLFFYDLETEEVTKELIGATLIDGALVRIQTNPNDLEEIFGQAVRGATCGIFAVANFTGTYEGTSTLTEIKSTVLPPINWETHPQASFVMTAQDILTISNPMGSTPVSATLGLERIAAKVTFEVTVGSSVVDGESPWTADTSNMTVYMVYAMRKASLAADPVDMPISETEEYEAGQTIVYKQYVDKPLVNTGRKATRSRLNPGTQTQTDTLVEVFGTRITGDAPFYSYPSTWNVGSSMEPYMKLIIPWTHNNVTKKYYYKIPFSGNTLERNHWYKISIDVQIVGTEYIEDQPPKVTVTYCVADWQGAMEQTDDPEIIDNTVLPATIIMARYLTVPVTEYVLYNEDQLVIPINSSHDVEVVGFTVNSNAYLDSHWVDANYVGSSPRIYNPFTTTLESTGKIVAVHPDYSATTPSAASHSFTYGQAADADGWSVLATRTSVTLTHQLNRNLSSNSYDVAPYTIRMRIRHQGEGESLYFTDVTIEQRPPIIIKPEANSGGNANYGYAFVNASQNGSGGQNTSWTSSSYQSRWTYYLGSSPTTISTTSNNYNNNMYVIETSVLPSEGTIGTYVLGDARSKNVDNITGTTAAAWSQSRTAVDGTTRRLTYYYPAGGAEYNNFIAPKFRIASSYGATVYLTFQNAQRRCASYQEDGYPAGRWRLPTKAEIEYISQLNADGKIPRLLGSATGTTDYWSNNGFVTVETGKTPIYTNNTPNDTKYVRCVYDEWYWEGTTHEKVTKGTFTWGDEQRSLVRKN